MNLLYPSHPLKANLPDEQFKAEIEAVRAAATVDVVQRADGQFRIVEVGVGQVSDLFGWKPEQFAALLSKFMGKPSAPR